MGNLLRRIFSIPYSLYSYVVYFISLIIMFLCSVFISIAFSKHKAERYFLRVLKIWSDTWMFLSGIRYRFVGRENYRRDRSYVMVSNHYSLLDMMTGAVSVYPNVKVLAKAEIKKVPFFNKLFAMGSVFVDRKSKESREESKRQLTAAFNRGLSIFLYPEGTRNRTRQPLKEFYDGAFKIAIEQQAPIMPMVVTNSRFVNRLGSSWLWPGRYEIHFLPAIETKGLTESNVTELKEKTYRLMEETILQFDRWFSGAKKTTAPEAV